MKIIDETITVETTSKVQLIDITGDIHASLKRSGLNIGSLLIFSPHTTTALIINEGEQGLVKDMEDAIKSFMNLDKVYRHDAMDDNGASHIVGAFLGNDLSLIVKDGSLLLSVWQRVFLVELDGPRSRKVMVRISGE